MALEQPLPEFVRATGDEEFINVMQETLRRGILRFVQEAPSSPTAPGIFGDWHANTTHFYICIAKNTWRRVALSSTW